MKVPFGWLKDYVNVGPLNPEKVADRLTIAGFEVVLIEKIGGDSVFDIEVTPNRPDCLSILGVAREVAACLGKKLKAPKSKVKKGSLKERPIIEIKDKKLCPRYTGRIIRNVKVAPSPKWLVEKLERMDLRTVNNVADITNYCLFELGQPTHAFDYDKIKGKIIVRRARKNEKIVTIDGKERKLDADMLVIADEARAIAIGGVMGSKDTEVTDDTKNILFESAYFNPISIRRTSRRLGLISESSYRFERSVDMGRVVETSDRACGLIAELSGGGIGPLRDAGAKDPKPVKIYLRPEKLKKLLGLKIAPSTIKKILSSLELKVELSGKETMVVSVPSFRQDLKGEVDLIEEVVRIYGYDKLASTMPTIIGHPERIEPSRELSDIVRDALISLGVDEVITYTLLSKEDLSAAENADDEKIITIQNPLSIEQEVMRTTLIPGILRTVTWNLNRGSRNLKIFELGSAYTKNAGHFNEEASLAIAFTGGRPHDWRSKRELSFFDMKGVLEALFERLGVEELFFKGEGFPRFLTDEAASIEVSKEKIGFVGRLNREILDSFGVETDLLLCEISLKKLFSHAKLRKKFREMPKFPSAKRDISIIAKKDVSYQKIVSAMKEAGGDLVVNIELFDQYFGAQIPQDSRGLAYAIEYRAQDRTLTDDEISGLHKKVCDTLREKLGTEIR